MYKNGQKIKNYSQKKYGVTTKNKGRIRKNIAPKYIGHYNEGVLALAQGENPEYMLYKEKGYKGILKEFVHILEDLIKEDKDIKRLNEVTMMAKIQRTYFEETTRRLKHSVLVANIAKEIADALGLESGITEEIAILHDIGHGPFGHDFEWMAAEQIKDRLGVSHFVHNAMGTWHLIYRAKFKEKVLEKIREEHPEILPWKLNLIRDNLWIILDGVLTHNGELSGAVFKPETTKTEAQFLQELEKCYVKKDFDREIVPATIEGCLLRISDIISYVGNDVVDGRREGIIDGLDEKYEEILEKFGVEPELLAEIRKKDEEFRLRKKQAESKEELKLLREEEREFVNSEYSKIEKVVRRALIDNLIENSDKTTIQLSEDMADILYGRKEDKEKEIPEIIGLRKHNYNQMVSRVTQDAEQYLIPEGIGIMLDVGKEILVKEGLIASLDKSPQNRKKLVEKIKSEYASEDKEYNKNNPYMRLVDYVGETSFEEYEALKRVSELLYEQMTPLKRQEYSKQDIMAMQLTTHFMARMTDREFTDLLRTIGILVENLNIPVQIDEKMNFEGKYYDGYNKKAESRHLRDLNEKQER